MNFDNIFGKRKKGKDPFTNLFPKMKSQPLIPKSRKQGSGLTSLFPKMKKQKSIIPSIKMPQQRFLKKTTGMKQRFTDHDRDGVISGLDCFPFDKKKHSWKKKEKKDKIISYVGPYPFELYPDATRYKYKSVPIKKLSKREYSHDEFKVEDIKSSGEINEPIQVKNIKKPLQTYKNIKYTGRKDSEKIPYDPYASDKYVILDGHHRAIAASERGDTHIVAKVYDINNNIQNSNNVNTDVDEAVEDIQESNNGDDNNKADEDEDEE